jgi:hypothetical protein
MPGFNLSDYNTVAERVTAFYGKYPEGSLQSEIVELNESRVVMRAYAYRTPTDERPGIGYSSLGIPGSTPYTKGSEVENCETSAWGRAIAALGFEVKKGIASRDEIQNKQPDTAARPDAVVTVGDTQVRVDGGLIGTLIAQGRQDFEIRQTPQGPITAFRLKNGTKSYIIEARGPLAEALLTLKSTVLDQLVTVWGSWDERTFKKDGQDRAFRVLLLERIKTPDGILPAPEPALPEPPEEIPLPFEAVG